ncbi:NUDIX domain-containing protein [Streptomyces sp. NPDC055078]
MSDDLQGRGPVLDASVVVARDADGLVAVLSADFPGHGGEYLFLPGGRREPGEDTEDCARRELLPPSVRCAGGGIVAAVAHHRGGQAAPAGSG